MSEFAVVSDVYDVIFLLEPTFEEPGYLRLIFDHEDPHSRHSRIFIGCCSRSGKLRKRGLLDEQVALSGTVKPPG